MADRVNAATRSRMMSAIRSTNTGIEMRVRRYLHALGFRYRLHAPGLPGRPDLWFPARRAAIFTNGCFFHGHDCGLCRIPATRPEFWQKKIDGNRARDRRVRVELHAAGIRTLTVWECTFRDKRAKLSVEDSLGMISRWLKSGAGHGCLSARGYSAVPGLK